MAEETPSQVVLVLSSQEERKRLARFLEETGFPARETGSYEGAVNILENESVRALVCEVHGAGIDGMRLLKVAKRIDEQTGVVLVAESADIEACVQAMKLGAYDFLVKPMNKAKMLAVLERLFQFQKTVKENVELHKKLDEHYSLPHIIGTSGPMRRVFDLISQVAEAQSTVLIQGESGTGKDLVARAIHERSARRLGPYVQMNCGALAESLVESELFGHEKGAFTGAHERRLGRFELADGGTLFLDEVGELTPRIQVRLLRVLEDGSFERVGGSKTLRSDVRVIAATNDNMEESVRQGRFREDLYYRLKVVTIQLPALRERPEDIPSLSKAFLELFADREGKRMIGITEDATHLMKKHPWPGNVRELRNCVEGMVVLGEGPYLDVGNLPEAIRGLASQVEVVSHQGEGLDTSARCIKIPIGVSLAEIEERVLGETLKATGGNKAETARILGIGLRSVYRKIEKYKIATAPRREVAQG